MTDKAAVLTELNQCISGVRPQCVIEAGRPVLGYFCSYVPPELIRAAGLYPMRIHGRGVEDSATGDAYLSHLTCSFARSVASAVIDGDYDYLAGQISANACDHVRRANDAIQAKSDLAFHGFITVPRSFRDSLFPWYIEELARLKNSIEQHFDAKVTDEGLVDAIAAYNSVRERMQKIDELRRAEAPRLSGSEALTAHLAARILPPDRFIELADELIDAAEKSEPVSGIRARVLVTGGELDDPRFLRVIESQGAHVAGDLLCFGSRGMGQSVDPEGDPLERLARAYLHQIPCARMMAEFPRRYQALLDLYKEVRAQGIIFQRIKFCQIWSTEVHNLLHRFETEPLPMLVLDREYGMVSTGQIKTRVQAFLESLGA